MLAIDRWRKWRPFSCEPSEPSKAGSGGFEGSISREMQNFSGCDSDALDPWREDFARWKAENCEHVEGMDYRDSIGELWVDFCEWTVRHYSEHCDRRTFIRLLADNRSSRVHGAKSLTFPLK